MLNFSLVSQPSVEEDNIATPLSGAAQFGRVEAQWSSLSSPCCNAGQPIPTLPPLLKESEDQGSLESFTTASQEEWNSLSEAVSTTTATTARVVAVALNSDLACHKDEGQPVSLRSEGLSPVSSDSNHLPACPAKSDVKERSCTAEADACIQHEIVERRISVQSDLARSSSVTAGSVVREVVGQPLGLLNGKDRSGSQSVPSGGGVNLCLPVLPILALINKCVPHDTLAATTSRFSSAMQPSAKVMQSKTNRANSSSLLAPQFSENAFLKLPIAASAGFKTTTPTADLGRSLSLLPLNPNVLISELGSSSEMGEPPSLPPPLISFITPPTTTHRSLKATSKENAAASRKKASSSNSPLVSSRSRKRELTGEKEVTEPAYENLQSSDIVEEFMETFNQAQTASSDNSEETFSHTEKLTLLKALQKSPTTSKLATSLEGMYGENRVASLQFLCSVLQKYFFLNESSVFLDIGSGRGLPSLTVSLMSPVRASVGVEIDENVYFLSLRTLSDYHSVLLQRRLSRGMDIYESPGECRVAFAHMDAVLFDTLNPVTHVFSFDLAMPLFMIENPTAIVFVTFRRDLSEFDIDAEAVCQIPMEMMVSSERHRATIYVKRSHLPDLAHAIPRLGASSDTKDVVKLDLEALIASSERSKKASCGDCNGRTKVLQTEVSTRTTSQVAPAKSDGRSTRSSKRRRVARSPIYIDEMSSLALTRKFWACCDLCGRWRLLPGCTAEEYDLVESEPFWCCAKNKWDLSRASCAAPSEQAEAAEIDVDTLKWVQCGECMKWRSLPGCTELEYCAVQRKEVWVCWMNTWDKARANCDAPEQLEPEIMVLDNAFRNGTSVDVAASGLSSPGSQADATAPMHANVTTETGEAVLVPCVKNGAYTVGSRTDDTNNHNEANNSDVVSSIGSCSASPKLNLVQSGSLTNHLLSSQTDAGQSVPLTQVAGEDLHESGSTGHTLVAMAAAAASGATQQAENSSDNACVTLLLPPAVVQRCANMLKELPHSRLGNVNFASYSPSTGSNCQLHSIASERLATFDLTVANALNCKMSQSNDPVVASPLWKLVQRCEMPLIHQAEWCHIELATWLSTSGFRGSRRGAKKRLKVLGEAGRDTQRKASYHQEMEDDLDARWTAELDIKEGLEEAGHWCMCPRRTRSQSLKAFKCLLLQPGQSFVIVSSSLQGLEAGDQAAVVSNETKDSEDNKTGEPIKRHIGETSVKGEVAESISEVPCNISPEEEIFEASGPSEKLISPKLGLDIENLELSNNALTDDDNDVDDGEGSEPAAIKTENLKSIQKNNISPLSVERVPKLKRHLSAEEKQQLLDDFQTAVELSQRNSCLRSWGKRDTEKRVKEKIGKVADRKLMDKAAVKREPLRRTLSKK